ncbi:hypothetical protein GCM10009710_16160 [Aeromicrobium alkaliterrae]|uniref:Uncharacterized protein n=2 Tax=Aeromicrobium alkaliterrae TaxID=302168 RepID=A0ABN2JRM5_9ACTN
MTIKTSRTTDPMPAHTHPTTPGRNAGRPTGEEVSDMARFGRQARVKRAWDELSEADREVLLNQARERREQQAQRDARFVDAYSHRLIK